MFLISSFLALLSSLASVPCPLDTVYVTGEYCPAVSQPCLRWKDTKRKHPVVCAEFAPSKCISKHTTVLDFCIDRYEHADEDGLPSTEMSWLKAKATCESEGKRLCTEEEITLACEGPDALPYPYGYVRDSTACNIDQPPIDPFIYSDDGKPVAQKQLILLDKRIVSGSMPRCVSPYGVYDLVGDVDEWINNTRGFMSHVPYRSALHGGHWVQGARNRCRGLTVVHGPAFSMYISGFRCCHNVK